jgi:multidrug resistance protein, MATE family
MLAWPVILSNCSVPLLGMVDAAVMGHLDSPIYLGGVALGALVFDFLYWAVGFLRMGTTGFVAQAFGRRDDSEIKAIVIQTIQIALVIAACVWSLAWPIETLSFYLIQAEQAVEQQGQLYFWARIWGAPFVLINYVVIGTLMGMQKPMLTLVIQIATNGLNVVLDLLFVWGFHWGVEGVAWATVISQVVSCVLGLILIRKYCIHDLSFHMFRQWSRGVAWKHMLRVNSHLFVRTFLLMGALALFTVLGAKMGTAILAANAILMNLQYLLSFALDGFAHAAESLVGEGVGKKDLPHVDETIKWVMIFSGLVAAGFTLLYALAYPFFIHLMTSLPEVAQVAQSYGFWMVISPLIAVWCFGLDGIFIGATQTKAMLWSMVFSACIYYALALVAMERWQNHGLWAALMIFYILRLVSLGAFIPQLRRRVIS